LSYVARATREVLRRRATLLATVRAFFAARNVLEVETPALSTAATPDLALESVTAGAHTFGERRLYLHTSPEYAMKRLLAAGVGDIYQICRVFRDDEFGRWHQPEFTLLEWYRLGWDDVALMREVQALVQVVLATGATLRDEAGTETAALEPVRYVTYAAAFAERLGCELGDEAGIRAGLARLGIDVPAGLELRALTDLAFGAAVAPHFPSGAITFVHDYPADQAALARLKPQSPPVAARFELFAGGVELGNGFAELTDAAEQRRRFETERSARRRNGRHVPPLDEAFLAALERGLPECAGVAVGLDRLVAVALKLDDLGAALAFEHQPFAS
jgi:elongation factor P--(R)-beta-lysine ligase